MVKAKHWLCIGAITLALAPAAWADEPNAGTSWIENILAQIVAQIVGSPDELGGHVPVGGSELGGHIPPGGESLVGEPEPGQSEIGGQVPIGG